MKAHVCTEYMTIRVCACVYTCVSACLYVYFRPPVESGKFKIFRGGLHSPLLYNQPCRVDWAHSMVSQACCFSTFIPGHSLMFSIEYPARLWALGIWVLQCSAVDIIHLLPNYYYFPRVTALILMASITADLQIVSLTQMSLKISKYVYLNIHLIVCRHIQRPKLNS